jgi:hypothetical protein
MRSALRLLPLFIRTRTVLSSQGVLMAVAFAACSALFLTVAGGLWAFLQWDTSGDETGTLASYKILAGIATALLLVPAMTLGQAAANLAARSETDRLSGLSLLGASPRTITVLAVARPVTVAVLGAVVGVAGYFVLLLPVSLIPFQGSGLGYAQMVLPWWALLAAVVLLVLVSAASAFVGLRRLVVSPLGVRTRSIDRRFPWVRLVVGIVGLGVAYMLVSLLQSSQGFAMFVAFMLAAMVIGLVVVDVLGVLFVRLIAHWGAQRATSPDRLIAARLVSDAPKQYWRQVSGLAMTSFIAVVAGTGVSFMVELDGMDGLIGPQTYLGGDMRTGVLLTLGIALLFITVSAVVNQTAQVHDRADTYRELHAAGMEEETVAALTVRATMMPVVWVSLLSAGLGMLLVLPMAGFALVVSPATFLVMLSTVAIGILVLRGGLRLTPPTERPVTHADA